MENCFFAGHFPIDKKAEIMSTGGNSPAPGLGPVAPVLVPELIVQVATGVIAVFGTLLNVFEGFDLETEIETLLEELTNPGDPGTATTTAEELDQFTGCFRNSVNSNFGCGCSRVDDLADRLDDLCEQIDKAKEPLGDLDAAITLCGALRFAMKQVLDSVHSGFTGTLEASLLCRQPPSFRPKYKKVLKQVRVCKTYTADTAGEWWRDPVTANLCTVCAGRYAFNAFLSLGQSAFEFFLFFKLLRKFQCITPTELQELRLETCRYMEKAAELFSLGDCPKECLEYETKPRYVNIRC